MGFYYCCNLFFFRFIGTLKIVCFPILRFPRYHKGLVANTYRISKCAINFGQGSFDL